MVGRGFNVNEKKSFSTSWQSGCLVLIVLLGLVVGGCQMCGLIDRLNDSPEEKLRKKQVESAQKCKDELVARGDLSISQGVNYGILMSEVAEPNDPFILNWLRECERVGVFPSK